MNWDIALGQWKRTRGKLNERYGEFRGDAARIIKGKREQFAGELQVRYGVMKYEAQWHLNAFRIPNKMNVDQNQ